MGYPGCKRGFRVYLGNPDCTDLKTWPLVRCKGALAHEYRFSVQMPLSDGRQQLQEFAWRRTRAKDLGAGNKGHRDFKLVAIGSPVTMYQDASTAVEKGKATKETLIDIDDEDDEEIFSNEKEVSDDPHFVGQNERLIAVYNHEFSMKGCRRSASIVWYQALPAPAELWCLTTIFGLQEKITTNKQAFAIAYYGTMQPLGSYF
jgi:hypothetical protein